MDVSFSQAVDSSALKQAEFLQQKKDAAPLESRDQARQDNASESAGLGNVAKAVANPADNTSELVEKAIGDINEFVQAQNRQLNFSYDETSSRSIIKVTDVESGEVIRQIPSEEVIKLAERIRDLQSEIGAAVGILFNKSV